MKRALLTVAPAVAWLALSAAASFAEPAPIVYSGEIQTRSWTAGELFLVRHPYTNVLEKSARVQVPGKTIQEIKDLQRTLREQTSTRA
ncbi:hypothetical protein [Gloeobacter violaceus]|uniref:hypothetical protein n=1 Tax=Gloeobacter violaceus TaxID=33072 RepID=UPI0002D9DB18|nr:hypothetical protein [Gloeobacter violaceus]